METLLKLFAIALAAISGMAALHFLFNSKKIYKKYAALHKGKPKTLMQKLNWPNENIRKLHVALAPIMIGLSVFCIVYVIRNW